MGGLTNPVKGPYIEPLYAVHKPPDNLQQSSDSDQDEDEQQESEKMWTLDKVKKGIGDKDTHSDQLELGSPLYPQYSYTEPIHKVNKITTVPELELRKLERGKDPVSVLLCLCLSYGISFISELNCFPFLDRFLLEQSVTASFCGDAGAALVLSQQ